jgi:tRNA-dihydrouridine synthase B
MRAMHNPQIGSIQLKNPFAQAALSGYSDWPMRMMAKRFGASYTLCEVMLDQFLVSLKDRERTRHFLYNTLDEQPVAGQLMGSEPQQFALGAQKLAQAGFSVIDINFGCPVKKVLGRCRGGFHLSQPEVALEIVQRTRDILPTNIPVTLKMRRGMDDSQASREAFFTILDGAFDYGVAAITVHGRTVVQRYNGPSRWSFLKEVKSHVGTKTILGSGDLFTAQDCIAMIEQTGVDGVTIARGCIGNPWIFEQAIALLNGEALPEPPSLHQQRETMADHFKLAAQIYGDERASISMRKFGIKYAANHPQHELVRTEFARVKSGAEWFQVLDRWYAIDSPGRYPDSILSAAMSES